MRTIVRRSLALLGMIALIGVFAGPADAALINCGPTGATDLTDKITDGTGTNVAVSDCQYVDPPDESNVATIGNINAAGFFGFSDWETNNQTQVNAGGGASGSWSISNVDFATYSYIIVFKDGARTNLIAFLFNELYSSGLWSTPFVDPPFDLDSGSGSQNASHFTIARRLSGGSEEENPISEPAILLMMGVGFALAAGRFRRRRG